MSLRYAHLAPDQQREAVAKLNERLVLALAVEGPAAAVSLPCRFHVEREGTAARA
jgi:hypothetical protein